MPPHSTIPGAQLSRRHFLRGGVGLGAMALAAMLPGERCVRAGQSSQDSPRPHHSPRARSVIFLHMVGAPSTLDLFDPKVELNRRHGQPCPEAFVAGQTLSFIRGRTALLGSPFRFARHGRSGQWMSELLPHLARVADELCVVRSVHTDQFNHAPAQLVLHTGFPSPGRPGMGAWLTYGLGSENRELPGYVALFSRNPATDAGAALWSAGFLPGGHQGVPLRPEGDPVPYLATPQGISEAGRRRSLDTLQQLNRVQHERLGDPQILARIENYELAYRMQRSVPRAADLSEETAASQRLYGAEPGRRSFANNCLLARRLVENGVRFVQLFHSGWDQHGFNQQSDLRFGLVERCRETDQAVAALLLDLKQRGLLDSTLVVWGGEFGRTPMNEERDGSRWLGRDHHRNGYTMWLAGGGVKAGLAHGATDELGYAAVEGAVSVHDLHATILHLTGLDHERLTFREHGRDYRLTDVHGRVASELLA